jgi:hypothetical protein
MPHVVVWSWRQQSYIQSRVPGSGLCDSVPKLMSWKTNLTNCALKCTSFLHGSCISASMPCGCLDSCAQYCTLFPPSAPSAAPPILHCAIFVAASMPCGCLDSCAQCCTLFLNLFPPSAPSAAPRLCNFRCTQNYICLQHPTQSSTQF